MIGESGVILEHDDVLWAVPVGRFKIPIQYKRYEVRGCRCVRVYQHVSVPIDVLVGVEELAAVRYANEQCTTSS